MDDAEIYSKNNGLQKKDATECLEKYARKMKWKAAGDKVIDIGCGDGSVTATYLKKYLPDNLKLLVGCDINENMVKHANEHHGNDVISFTVLDIEADLPHTLDGSYNHAFSFYVLHWIKNQRKAFQNIFQLLAPGGDCLLLFLGYMPMYEVYRRLSRHGKWSAWVYDVERYVSPYHDVEDPELVIKEMMAQIGFQDIDVKNEKKTFIFDDFEALRKAVKAVIPFKIPEAMFDEFMMDYLHEYRGMNLADILNNNDKVITSYSLITVYASK